MKTKKAFLLFSTSVISVVLIALWIYDPIITPAFLNAVLMFVIPLSIGALIFSKTKADWSLFGIGAVTFVASQVLHIPFNSYVLEPAISNTGLQMTPKSFELLAVALFYGLSAGVFEEIARFVVYRKYLTKQTSWKAGIMFGAGHGGIEAIILGALVFFSFLQMLAMQGASPDLLSGSISLDQADLVSLQVAQFWASPWWLHLLGAFERLLAIILHVGMALLVQRAILRKEIKWLFAAIMFHTLIDMVAVYVSISYGVLATEAVLLVLALISIYIIFNFKKGFPSDKHAISELPPVPNLKPLKKIDSENDLISKIEESKYD